MLCFRYRIDFLKKTYISLALTPLRLVAVFFTIYPIKHESFEFNAGIILAHCLLRWPLV